MGNYIFLARVFAAVLGSGAILWGLITIPIFKQQASIEHVAQHIVRGEPYTIDTLRRQMPEIERVENSTMCRPIALWSAAIIRLRMVEQASRNEDDRSVDTSAMKKLDNSIRVSLSCSAAEPFLWLVLFWSASRQTGVNQDSLNYLRMSYKLGPNEGWIAVKRSFVTFSKYESLPPDLTNGAIVEFVALVNSKFFEQAADILSGPAWRLRDAVLPHLATLPIRRREAFARVLYNRGTDVKIPGIKPLKIIR